MLPQVHIDTTEVRQAATFAKKSVKEIPSFAKNYAKSLFPVAQWVSRYNLTWLVGDLIAAVTVGFLVLPQALAQAKIATLPPEYGLYTAFVGLVVYALFATTKDVTIGPTAVLSLVTAQTLASANKDADGNDIYPPTTFAVTLAFFTGIYQLAIGFLRLGILIDFLPSTVIGGFSTGAAITIIIQQLPSLLGIKGIDTNTQAPYKVVRDIAVSLPKTKIDAAWGFSAVVMLLALRYLKEFYGKRYRTFHYLGISRNGIVLVLFTLISFGVVSTLPWYQHSIVGTIPAGFKTPHVPSLDLGLVSLVFQPAFTVMLISIVEQVSIAKAFGRQFGYTKNINPSQEIVATGLTNFVGSFLSSYPATGSFSRSAVKAASGVRTPAAGWMTAVIVIIALYFLTPAFYYIPSSILAAVIMASISDLILTYDAIIEFWNISVLDFLVFLAALFITLFVGIEVGIYASVGIAALLLLLRLARPGLSILIKKTPSEAHYQEVGTETQSLYKHFPANEGIFVFQPQDSMLYVNSEHTAGLIREIATMNTLFNGPKLLSSDRLWFDNSQEKAERRERLLVSIQANAAGEAVLTTTTIASEGGRSSESGRMGQSNNVLPVLHAVVIDLRFVSIFDSGAYVSLVGLRQELSKYSGHVLPFYFAAVRPSIRRVLLNFAREPFRDEAGRPTPTPLVVEPEDTIFPTVELAVAAAQAFTHISSSVSGGVSDVTSEEGKGDISRNFSTSELALNFDGDKKQKIDAEIMEEQVQPQEVLIYIDGNEPSKQNSPPAIGVVESPESDAPVIAVLGDSVQVQLEAVQSTTILTIDHPESNGVKPEE